MPLLLLPCVVAKFSNKVQLAAEGKRQQRCCPIQHFCQYAKSNCDVKQIKTVYHCVNKGLFGPLKHASNQALNRGNMLLL